ARSSSAIEAMSWKTDGSRWRARARACSRAYTSSRPTWVCSLACSWAHSGAPAVAGELSWAVPPFLAGKFCVQPPEKLPYRVLTNMLVTPGDRGPRNSSMRLSTRRLFFVVALATLVLSGLGMGGVAVTLRHLSFARQDAAARGQETAGLLI